MYDMLEWFASHPCTDCGETDPLKLQPDHVQKVCYTSKGTRARRISTLITEGKPARLIKELELCVSRCASCHFKRHSTEDGSYRACSISDIRGEISRREGIEKLGQAVL